MSMAMKAVGLVWTAGDHMQRLVTIARYAHMRVDPEVGSAHVGPRGFAWNMHGSEPKGRR
jgi:hypothetical protein